MSKSTRYFLFGSGAVLTVGLCTGLFAYYGGLPMGAAAGVSGAAQELSYIPTDASMVAFADVQAVMSSELRQRLKPVLSEKDQGREKLFEATGIDVEKDVDRVVACFLASPADASPTGGGDGFAVIAGRFDAGRIEGNARAAGATVEDYKGKRVIKRSHGTADDKSGVVVFAEPGFLLIGDEAAVKQGIDQKLVGHSIIQNARMMELIGAVDQTSNAWVVGRADALSQAHGPFHGGLPVQLPAIDWFSASGHVNGGVSATFQAEAHDDAAAQNLRDVIQGFVALGRLQAGQKPELQTLLQTLQMSGSGKTVSLSIALPAEVLEKLLNKSQAVVAP